MSIEDLNPQLTVTLSVFELVIGLTCSVGLVLAFMAFWQYAVDAYYLRGSGDTATAVHIALRCSGALTLVNALFEVYVVIAALTPPPLTSGRTRAADINGLVFEAIVLILAVLAGFNLRDRSRISRGGP